MEDSYKKIRKYYSLLETRVGYTFLLKDSKHLGYYPQGTANISEQRAQEIYQYKIAEVLGLKYGEKVLDAGCGRGVVGCFLAQKFGINLLGIDILDFEIQRARRRAIKFKLGNRALFREGNYSAMNFKEEFDAVYANETLSHAPDLEKVFRNFYQALRPGGRLAIFEYILSEEKNFLPNEIEVLDFVIENSAMVGLKQFRFGKIADILKKTGFTNIKEKDITEYIKPSFGRLSRIACKFFPVIKLFGLQKKFINATAGCTLKPLVEKGLIHYFYFSADK